MRSGFAYEMLSPMGGMYRIQDLLKAMLKENADELRLEPGRPPIMVLHGKVRLMDGELVSSDHIAELFHSVATEEQNQELTRCGDCHFVLTMEHSERFRFGAVMDGMQLNLTVKNLSR